MSGKKNIVFGLLYLVLTAGLGPYMILQQLPVAEQAAQARQEVFGPLQLAVDADFENQETLEPMSAEEIAKMNSRALLALNASLNARMPVDAVKGGPHAHGNLEAVLNILAGLVLMFLAAPHWFRELVSWTFIAGALLHSGALYLAVVFQLPWAGALLGSGIGALLVLAGLLLLGVGSALWLRPRPAAE